MATIWRIVANWILPVPLILFLLLSLPLPRCALQRAAAGSPWNTPQPTASPSASNSTAPHPSLCLLPRCRSMRQGIILFTQRVFDLPLVGAFKLLHVMLWITAVAFLSE